MQTFCLVNMLKCGALHWGVMHFTAETHHLLYDTHQIRCVNKTMEMITQLSFPWEFLNVFV